MQDDDLTGTGRAPGNREDGFVDGHDCVFAQAITQRRFQCKMADRRQIAERETVFCRQPDAAKDCASVLFAVVSTGRFVSGKARWQDYPHAMRVKFVLGILNSLCVLTESHGDTPNQDIHALVSRTLSQTPADQLPLAEMIQQIAAHNQRIRKPRPNKE